MKKSRLILIITALLTMFTISGVLWFENQEETKLKNQAEISQINTDRARYNPGQKVKFKASLRNLSNQEIHIKVQYYYLDDMIEEDIVKVQRKDVDWTWLPPSQDFRGYYARIFPIGNEKESYSIAIDVSSTWTKFPRYGFLSNFSEMSKNNMENVLDQLNRYHINGLQFYDWHDEHHLPLKTSGDNAQNNWANIANQPVSLQTLKTYIDKAHQRNMETMAYNLLNGTLERSKEDGVQPQWYLFKDPGSTRVDTHELPDEWKSDIYLTDPGNLNWQEFIVQQQKVVFSHLPFDGWHIDQLGNRGEVFNADGQSVSLEDSYLRFLEFTQNQFPSKTILMNAVNQYGQKQIAESGAPFLYTEVWDPIKSYKQLKNIIEENSKNYRKNTILAAYMNYRKSEKQGTFHTPGILYTDALLFAHGGAHLELGEHMLSKEYFPHNKLSMSDQLKNSLTNYYDFMVGYQNLLRYRLKPAKVEIKASDSVPISNQPEQGKVYSFAKQKKFKKIIHLLNYSEAVHMNWRDTGGTQKKPKIKKNLSLTINESQKVKKVWAASPDWNNGLPTELEFTQSNDKVQLTLPYLQYWDIIVFEYK